MYCRNVCNDFFIWESTDDAFIIFQKDKCNVSEIFKKCQNSKILEFLREKIKSKPVEISTVNTCGCEFSHKDKEIVPGIYVSYDDFLTMVAWIVPDDYKKYRKIIFKKRLNFYSVTLRSLRCIIRENLSRQSNDVFQVG